jgi:hypothetical protein
VVCILNYFLLSTYVTVPYRQDITYSTGRFRFGFFLSLFEDNARLEGNKKINSLILLNMTKGKIGCPGSKIVVEKDWIVEISLGRFVKSLYLMQKIAGSDMFDMFVT